MGALKGMGATTVIPDTDSYTSNCFSGIGMPKPHVHLIPPPLNVALDARAAGNEARFVRSG